MKLSFQSTVTGYAEETDDSGFKVRHFDLQAIRGAEPTPEAIDDHVAESDCVCFTFADETVWYAPATDLPDLLGVPNVRSGTDGEFTLEVPSAMAAPDQERGFLGKLILKALAIFTPSAKAMAADLARSLAAKAEGQIIREGLHFIDRDFSLRSLQHNQDKLADQGPGLLLIHGTGSNTQGSFGDLAAKGSTSWNDLCDHFADRTFAFEHLTWTKNPIVNAKELLEALPAGSRWHILTHSRGGLVGDLLCRITAGGAFSEEEIGLFENDVVVQENLRLLNELAQEKAIRVERIVRVAAPAGGTTLLSERLDIFLNGLLNVVKLTGLGVLPFFSAFEELVKVVVSQRQEASVLPGLEAMHPESPTQVLLNFPNLSIPTQLHVIAGQAAAGGILGTITYLLSRLFFGADNDLVVDTDAMFEGVHRSGGQYYRFFTGKDVHHFSFFKNPDSQRAIVQALSAPDGNNISLFKPIREGEINRVLLESGSVFPHPLPVEADKPLVFVLPGIMGSNLSDDEGEIWLQYLRMMFGGLLQLRLDNPYIKAQSLVATSYRNLATYLEGKASVRVFPFDWRESVTRAAERLQQEIEDVLARDSPPTVRLLAHSMGGLVVRQLMIDYPETWAKLKKQDDTFRCVLLGTPWRGSYLIPQVLTGNGGVIKKLGMLAIFQSRKDLLKIFNKFKGLWELAPLAGHDFSEKAMWTLLRNHLKEQKWPTPEAEQLEYFASYRERTKKALEELDLEGIIYIAGQDEATIADISVVHHGKRSLVDPQNTQAIGKELKKPFTSLEFMATNRGDGSVTWKTGIPSDDVPVYYMPVTHGAMARADTYFDAIWELLDTGTQKSGKLADKPPVLEEKETFSRYRGGFLRSNDPEQLVRGILQLESTHRFEPLQEQVSRTVLEVSLASGHLKYARFPVMVGHFQQDNIVSAEAVINYLLDSKLKERWDAGLYPGEIGSHLLVLNPVGALFAGCCVVGLGYPEALTPALIGETVRKGALNYAFYVRDNTPNEAATGETGISTLLIGSGYGDLSLPNIVQAIIEGVQMANDQIEQLASGAPAITHLEFIELYEEKSEEAFYLIHQLMEDRPELSIRLSPKIRHVQEGRQYFPIHQEQDWWKRLSVSERTDDYTDQTFHYFESSGKRARVDMISNHSNQRLWRNLLRDQSYKRTWDQKVMQTVFNLIVPNSFKSSFRDQQNILLRLDKRTAWIPWELLHDDPNNSQPMATKAGIVRQLATSEMRTVQPIRNRHMLIVGDPDLGSTTLPQLTGAQREARIVHELLEKKGFHGEPKIGSTAPEVLHALNGEYQILHIACHGVVNYGADNLTGIYLSEDYILTPADLNQTALEKTPELVFINCCHLGEIDPDQEAFVREKNRLAANIGTLLIENGVKAVVVAGWAVDDNAALEFARRFYEKMLQGVSFGEAVKDARYHCHRENPQSTTWGAYQCYGDPLFTFDNRFSGEDTARNYILEREILIDLEKMLNNSSSPSRRWAKDLLHKMHTISKSIERSNLRTAEITEREAAIYAELGDFASAIKLNKILFEDQETGFSWDALADYCNLRARYAALPTSPLTSEERKNELGWVEKQVSNMLEAFAETAKRYELLGSTWKRYAMIETDKTKLLDYLDKCSEAYLSAFDIRKANHHHNHSYPGINWLTSEKLRHPNKEIARVRDELGGLSIHDWLNELIKINQDTPHSNNFWDLITLTNLYQARLIYATNQAEREQYREMVESTYIKAWNIGGSIKQKMSELAQVRFTRDVLQKLGRGQAEIRPWNDLYNFLNNLT